MSKRLTKFELARRVSKKLNVAAEPNVSLQDFLRLPVAALQLLDRYLNSQGDK